MKWQPITSVLFYLTAVSAHAVNAPSMQTEIQMDICGANIRQVVSRLRLDYSASKTRETYIFDAADHHLSQQGVILRLRRTDEKDRFTIKLRNPNMSRLTDRLRENGDFKCEVDHHVGRLSDKVYTTCSLEKTIAEADVENVLAEEAEVYDLFTSLQRHFVLAMRLNRSEFVGAHNGPVVHQRVWKFPLPGLSADAVLEYSKQYNNQRIEFSLRVPHSEADKAKGQTLAWLTENNLTICD